jgi:CRP/FNR family transcriptional regulator, anaerobic regulatory protein
MDKSSLISYLSKFDKIHPDLEKEVLDRCVFVQQPKKFLVHEAGKICDQFYFMIKGAARCFMYSEGKDVTTDIIIDGELFIAFASFISRQPSHESIELLEDSTYVILSYSDLQYLYEKHPQMNKIGRLIAEHNYVSKSLHAHLLRVASSLERYEHLLRQKPEIIQRISLGIIASYLGMSLENLSRIRKQKGQH